MRGACDRKDAHTPNSDVGVGGGSQDGGGGHPPPSSTPPPPSPPPSTTPQSPAPPPSTPLRSPSPPPLTPLRSPAPPPSTPPRSPSPPPSTPPWSPSRFPSPLPRSPSPSPPPPPPRSLSPSRSPSPSPPQSPVSVLPSASTSDKISLQLWESNVDDCADCTEQKAEDNKEMIMSLIAEVGEQNHVMIQKIKMLSERYKYYRPIERDGNCFYRAFMFSYLEHVLNIEDYSERISEVTHFRKCIEKAKQAYGNLISSPWGSQTSFLPAFGAFEYVFNLIEAGLSSDQLYWADMDDSIILSTVPCLRSLTEIELCSQEEFYNPFLSSVEEYESVHEFCQYEVHPMGTEANHWQIMALVNALGIPLVLENLDTSLSYGMVQINQHTFCPRRTEINVFANSSEEPAERMFEAMSPVERTFEDLSPVERRRTVTLLYRPGHYDILYLK